MPKSAFNKLINPKVIIVVKRPNNSKKTGNIDPRMNEIIQIIETESDTQVCLIFFGNISTKGKIFHKLKCILKFYRTFYIVSLQIIYEILPNVTMNGIGICPIQLK